MREGAEENQRMAMLADLISSVPADHPNYLPVLLMHEMLLQLRDLRCEASDHHHALAVHNKYVRGMLVDIRNAVDDEECDVD